MEEIWKDIPGFESRYQISNFGRVKSLNYRGTKISKCMTPKHTRDGYCWVSLANCRQIKTYYIHRLVAENFILNPYNYPEVNHKDENKDNNHIDNLEWCSKKYNHDYGTRLERQSRAMINGKLSKPISQFTHDGIFIRSFPSIQEAERQTGIKSGNIANVLTNRSYHAGGYIWRYLTN